MASLQRQKLQLNNCLIIILLFYSCLPFKLKASDDNVPDWASVVQVEYDYDFFYNQKDSLDCKGNLILKVSYDNDDLLSITLCRSVRNYRTPFLIRSVYPVNSVETVISVSDILWNTDFKLAFLYKDRTYDISPVYNINDYIMAQDLERLQTQATVERVDSESLKLEVKNHKLYIDTHEMTALTIFDLTGNVIARHICNEPTSISLENVKGPYIIVHYANSKFSNTQKFIIK